MKFATSLAVLLALPACTVTRPIAPAPAPESIQEYLRAHPRTALRVTDSTGQVRWVYDAFLSADTLRGLRSTTMPRRPVTIPLTELSAVSASRLSAVRTLGLFGGILAVGVVLALSGPGPIY